MCYEQRYIICEESSSFEAGEVDTIVEYCKSFINTTFYGETSSRNKIDYTEDILNDVTGWYTHTFEKSKKANTNEDSVTTLHLGAILKLLHRILNGNRKENENDITKCLYFVATKRRHSDQTVQSCYKRLVKEFEIFLKFQKEQRGQSANVPDNYWASRQQLRAGKVIADHIHGKGQPIDPIFGVLLCPNAGHRNRKNRKDWIHLHSYKLEHNFWWDYKEIPTSFHAVMYDAFTYLKEHHNIGPGSDYLGAYSLYHSDPLSAKASSKLFWDRTLNRIIEEEIYVDEKIL